MNPGSMSTWPKRRLLAGLFLVAIAALAIGWTAGTVAASSGSRAASPTAASLAAGPLGVPGVGTTTTLAQSGTAASIAYPLPGYNSLGAAPAGTILAQGTGTADTKTDGSDKAAALNTATSAALADAHAQALAAAASMGVQLEGLYSVSITTSTSYTYPMPDCLIAPLKPGLDGGSTGSSGGVTVSPPAICAQPMATAPTSTQLVVTLTVAYKYA